MKKLLAVLVVGFCSLVLGVRSSAVGVAKPTVVKSITFSVPAAEPALAPLSCPDSFGVSGWAVGGGFEVPSGVDVRASHPTRNEEAWHVKVFNGTASDQTVTAWVVCLKK